MSKATKKSASGRTVVNVDFDETSGSGRVDISRDGRQMDVFVIHKESSGIDKSLEDNVPKAEVPA